MVKLLVPLLLLAMVAWVPLAHASPVLPLGGHRPPKILVSGHVFCDQCKMGLNSLFTVPLQDAEVGVTCVDVYGFVTYNAVGYTSNDGAFQIPLDDLPLIYGVKGCKAHLVSSSDFQCNMASSVGGGNSGAKLVLNSRSLEEVIFTSGPFAYRPSKPLLVCSQSPPPPPTHHSHIPAPTPAVRGIPNPPPVPHHGHYNAPPPPPPSHKLKPPASPSPPSKHKSPPPSPPSPPTHLKYRFPPPPASGVHKPIPPPPHHAGKQKGKSPPPPQKQKQEGNTSPPPPPPHHGHEGHKSPPPPSPGQVYHPPPPPHHGHQGKNSPKPKPNKKPDKSPLPAPPPSLRS